MDAALIESNRRKKQFILSKCRKCGGLIIADTQRKSRACPRCGHSNDTKKLKKLNDFSTMKEAQNALRYFEIPEEKRDKVPFKQGDGTSLEFFLQDSSDDETDVKKTIQECLENLPEENTDDKE